MIAHVGEIAALATAACWTVTSLSFESAGRRVGSLPVNILRLALALVLLTAFGAVVRGRPLPADATGRAWLWLGLSGLVGFSIGDLCLFRAFVLMGARLAMLFLSLVPPLVALIGWAVLGERLGAADWLGLALTVSGVTWVVSERSPRNGALMPGRHPSTAGVLLGLGAVVGQAVGLVLSKYGMGAYHPFAATQIRVIAGLAGFALLFTAFGWWPRVRAALRDRVAMARTALGAVFGPFLGVSLSLLAVQQTQAGVASAIMSIVPVLIILPSVLLFRERVTARAVMGAALAVGGVAVLFLV